MSEKHLPPAADASNRTNHYSRLDNGDDAVFHSKARMVPHLDSLALETVSRLIENLVVEENPIILDLMASWDSHIPERLQSCTIVGLGLNETELKSNPVLSESIIHDLNRESTLPFSDNSFDIVLNTVSVDYLIRPVEIFREVGRILKPGGLFLVIFSNRMFPEKAVKIWRESDEEERVRLVEDYFRESRTFLKTEFFISRGRPRPKNDKYADFGIPSDPIFAIYAEKPGRGNTNKPRPPVHALLKDKLMDTNSLEEKKRHIHKTLECPYCDERMKKWAVPENPFGATWANDFLYICFNDECPYYVRGWDHVYKSTAHTASYRFMYDPEKNSCAPIPVPSSNALKESIID